MDWASSFALQSNSSVPFMHMTWLSIGFKANCNIYNLRLKTAWRVFGVL